MDKKSKKIICVYTARGKTHDFNIFKKSKVYLSKNTHGLVDTGYIGITKLQSNFEVPAKRKNKKEHKLSKEQKENNRRLSSLRVTNEHIIGFVKRFSILSERYRNRRKRFGLRFNLIAAICNLDSR